jgi:Amt family ammonium transporter
VDDPVGAISVHGVCGAFGTLCVGLFSQAAYGKASGAGAVNGLFFGGGLKPFLVQLTGVIAIFIWTSITAFILFRILKATVGLRVTREEELRGLDIEEHGMEAYAGFQIFTTQ